MKVIVKNHVWEKLCIKNAATEAGNNTKIKMISGRK